MVLAIHLKYNRVSSIRPVYESFRLTTSLHLVQNCPGKLVRCVVSSHIAGSDGSVARSVSKIKMCQIVLVILVVENPVQGMEGRGVVS